MLENIRDIYETKPHNPVREAGQGLVEYALLLVLVALAAVVPLTSLGQKIGDSLEGLDWGDEGSGDSTQPLTAQVVGDSRAGIGGVRVFAYTDEGTYLEIYQDTAENGRAQFDLGDGRYQLLAQHQLQWFWSDVVSRPGQTSVVIDTGQRPFQVTVVDMAGNGVAELPVYVYNEDDEYVGVEGQTDENGLVTLNLVDANVKFRVDHEGKTTWSDIVPTSQDEITITLSACGDGEYLAEYFNNRNLSGEPVLSRCESEIDNSWGTGGPGNGVATNNFSVRWTGYYVFEENTYSLFATADDGVRVWLDGSILINAWKPQSATTYRSRQTLSGRHEIKMEYYEQGGHAVAVLGWEEVITSCPTGQFMAEYFNNSDLSGEPTSIRCEDVVSNDWKYSGPGEGISSNRFSVRWTGRFNFEEGVYAFGLKADDGVRLWVDNQLIANAWVNKGYQELRPRQTLTGGEHEIKLEYYEWYGAANAKLSWEKAIVSCPTGQFLAEYYNNLNLQGDPILTRCENSINYSWNTGSPADGVNKDNFSVRWTGTFQFDGGETTFTATTDDGMQVFIDNSLLINSWRNQPRTEYSAALELSGGEHEIRVNYYERGGHAVAALRWQ